MKKIKKERRLGIVFLIIFFTGFIADVFFITPDKFYTDWVSDVRLFLLLLLWLFIVKISHFTSIATFKLTLIFLFALSFFFIFFRDHIATERLASWIYFFLFTGVIQQLFESRKQAS